MRKVCLQKKEKYSRMMQIFHQADQQQLLGGGKEGAGGGSTLSFLLGVSSVTQEPLAFTTPCWAVILLP